MDAKKRWLILGLFLSAAFCQGAFLATQGQKGVSPKPRIVPTPTLVTPPFQGVMTPAPAMTPTPGAPFVPGFIAGHGASSASK